MKDKDQTKPNESQGLFRKFEIRRVDGSDAPGGKHFGCEYFVLDTDHDQHAKAALQAYAASCELTHPQLSKDLKERYGRGFEMAPRPTEFGSRTLKLAVRFQNALCESEELAESLFEDVALALSKPPIPQANEANEAAIQAVLETIDRTMDSRGTWQEIERAVRKLAGGGT